MKFSVQHRTTYVYSSFVYDSFNDARLCPVSDDLQCCVTYALVVTPTATSVLRRLDFYLNQVNHFEVIESHKQLEVVATSEVETFADTRDFAVPSRPEGLVDLGRDEKFYDFLSSSERIGLIPMVVHEAKMIVPTIHDVQRAVETVMAFVFNEFAYESGATVVDATAADVWQKRRGVCQDFAHVMIALCRALDVPARYVSGYFYVAPQAGMSAQENNTQSHAWVECFLPNIGWVGYDPTHDRRVNDVYVKVAIGRDYTDVRPLSGTFNGKAKADLRVSVRIDRLD